MTDIDFKVTIRTGWKFGLQQKLLWIKYFWSIHYVGFKYKAPIRRGRYYLLGRTIEYWRVMPFELWIREPPACKIDPLVGIQGNLS